MTNLLSFDEIDAYLTEHDGGCVHEWEPKYWHSMTSGDHHDWYCKKPDCMGVVKDFQLENPPCIVDNPIARDLGKLFDLAVKHHIKTESIHSYKYGKGIQTYLYSKIVIKCYFKDYDSPQLAACAALSNAICAVLKDAK